MPEASRDALILKSKRVAFTGRLASMTRADALALVREHGGVPHSTVTLHTSFLVVGQDGWPLQKDGRLTNKLRKARSLQRAGYKISVLPEQELLNKLGVESHSEEVRRHYNTTQLSSILKIPGERLRKWLEAGLIQAIETVNGVSHFDYSQVVSAKTLCNLMHAGVKADRLRRSIQQLRSWLGDVEQPLLQLAVLEQDGELLVRLDDGLADPTGQRCFDFSKPVKQSTITLAHEPAAADEWFKLGCEQENAGQTEKAVKAYRQALLVGGPNAALCFNLANALCALGQKEQAVERYYQSVELDGSFAEAWNNLGIVLGDLGRTAEAIGALQTALAHRPQYADGHYNLADLLDDTGDQAKASIHWKAYLRQDAQGEWAAHARRRLTAIDN